ncbi:MAG TPA: Ig-like domain-containing protein [Methanomassiliicoccaceae archaeon]|nr:Ig-like domain-containing protein [Methanomassiliicoccaceae archaeon]
MRIGQRRRVAALLRPLSAVLVIGLLLTVVIPPLLDEGAPHGAIIGGLGNRSSDITTPSGDGGEVEPRDRYEDFELGVESSSLDVEVGDSHYEVRTDEYTITVSQDGNFVDYVVKPHFTDDVIRYRRINPNVAAEGTVDEKGNDLNWVSMRIADHGRDGNRVWFVESSPQFSMRNEFTIYRDYFELDTTYIPGEKNAVVAYFVGLYDQDGRMIDLFSDGKVHRYVPGFAEDRPKTHGIGGWYPSFEMFAPSFDIRQPGGDLGLEWGYNEEEAYLWAPVWMKDFGGGGPSTFCLKFSSKSSVLPDPAKGEETTYHMFVRPYKHSDGEPIGHNYGYAKWVAHEIAKEWSVHNTDIFPLTMNTLSTWDEDLRRWVENSQITVAMQSTNPEQIDWHYKSAQLMVPHDGTMPSSWQLHNAPGQQMYSPSGYRIASAASPEYREHLIYGDPYNDWWWSSDGVFWDEVNVVDGANNIRNDYNQKDEFVYTGFLRLVEESYGSGKFDYVITNPFTALLHLSMVSDLSLIEGYEAVPMYNNDLKAHTRSVMSFVNNMPSELRPHISVDQNYAASSDAWAVHSVLFGAARYGFYPNLRSYDPGAAQIPYLKMAEDMFLAMGADRTRGPQFWPATIDLGSEGNEVVTNRPMVVMTGAGAVNVEFTSASERYSLTNLWSTDRDFVVVLPADAVYTMEGLTQVGYAQYTADGKVIMRGKIAAGATGHIVKSGDAAVTHSGDGVAFAAIAAGELRVSATGGVTTVRLGNLLPSIFYDILGNGDRLATVRADDGGWISFSHAFGDEMVITTVEAPPPVPEVMGIVPYPGANDVPTDSDITVTFNTPVDRQAMEGAFVFTAPGEWAWIDDVTARFNPSASLDPYTEHTVEIGRLISLEGKTNDTTYRSAFTTGSSPAYNLAGTVIGNGPVANALVTLDGERTAVTDEDGRFEFHAVTSGRHALSASCDGFKDASIAIDVDGDTETVIEMKGAKGMLLPVASAGEVGAPMLGFIGAAALLFGIVATGRARMGVRTVKDFLNELYGSLHRARRP